MIHPPRQEYLDAILHEETRRIFASNTFSLIKERFLETGADIYPKQALEEMQRDTYDPIILSYAHASPDPNINLYEVVKLEFLNLFMKNAGKHFLVAFGNVPTQHFSLAEEFVKKAREYLGTATRNDPNYNKMNDPHYHQMWNPIEPYIRQSPHFELLFGLLETNFSVFPLESPDLLRWKREAEGDRELKQQILHGESVLEDAGVAISHYIDIQRDVYNLEQINKLRPLVIAISTMHALAYDMLLNRDGSRSFYFPNLNPEQLVEFSLRSEVHGLYRERMKK